MAYQRINWQDGESGNTPLSAENLNKMDKAIEDNSNNIGDLSNLNTTNKDNLVNAINEISNNSIIDYGNNENGFWIKMSNGILLQWGKQEFDVNYADFWGMKGTQTFRINYPIEFFENTSCCATICSGTESWLITASEEGTKTQSQEFRAVRPSGLGDGNANLKMIFQAIGKWK